MCLRRFVLLPPLFALILGGCCIEGNPVLYVDDVTVADVPASVRRAFDAKYDAREVSGVEHRWFKSRCVGDASYYVFHLQDGRTVTVDDKGRSARLRDDATLSGT
jgi:hypothetical protein